jgi:hypothetical protein
MRHVVALGVAIALLSSLGCYTAGVYSPAAREGNQKVDRGMIWFWGISNAITRANECQQGLAEAETQIGWYTPPIALVTLGIMFPVKRLYTCAGP